jgi:hypothetical protein
MNLTSLADFKRFLATPGATVQIVRHDWVGEGAGKIPAKDHFFDPRKVQKLQTNAVAFVSPHDKNGSWLWFRKAKDFRFEGDVVTMQLEDGGDWSEVMQYKCWIE